MHGDAINAYFSAPFVLIAFNFNLALLYISNDSSLHAVLFIFPLIYSNLPFLDVFNYLPLDITSSLL